MLVVNATTSMATTDKIDQRGRGVRGTAGTPNVGTGVPPPHCRFGARKSAGTVAQGARHKWPKQTKGGRAPCLSVVPGVSSGRGGVAESRASTSHVGGRARRSRGAVTRVWVGVPVRADN